MNQPSTPRKLPPRNPITYEKHRREVFWQITVPVMVGVAILVFAAVAIVVGANAVQISKMADISLIYLIIPTMIITILFIAINAAFVYALIRLIQVLPLYSRQAQDFLIVVRIRVRQVSDKVVSPILGIKSFNASARQLGRSLRGSWRRG